MLDLDQYRMVYKENTNEYMFYIKRKDQFNTEYYERLTKDDGEYYYAIGAYIDFFIKGKKLNPASAIVL